jgi:hypothetical protein
MAGPGGTGPALSGPGPGRDISRAITLRDNGLRNDTRHPVVRPVRVPCSPPERDPIFSINPAGQPRGGEWNRAETMT